MLRRQRYNTKQIGLPILFSRYRLSYPCTYIESAIDWRNITKEQTLSATMPQINSVVLRTSRRNMVILIARSPMIMHSSGVSMNWNFCVVIGWIGT